MMEYLNVLPTQPLGALAGVLLVIIALAALLKGAARGRPAALGARGCG